MRFRRRVAASLALVLAAHLALLAPAPAAASDSDAVVDPPPPTLTQSPPSLTRSTRATFAFEGPAGASFECGLDGAELAPCASPITYRGLASRLHRFRVRAVYPAPAPASAAAVHEWQVDAIRPTAAVTRLRHPGDRTRLRLVWSTADRGSGVANSDVRWRRSGADGRLLPWRRPARWQRTTATRVTLDGVRGGRKYCFAVRARDAAGNRSAWTPRRCRIANREVRTTSEGFRYGVGSSPVFGTEGALHTYSAEVQPGTRFDVNRFTNLVDAYLGARKGWSRGRDVRLQRVPPHKARIRVVLATPSTVDRHCSWIANTAGYFSCWSGRYVMINMNRWHHGAEKFTGTLAQYRGYVLNHEVGHALGRRHRSCPARGRLAPVMMQQSKGTYPCKPNPWPYP